MATQLYNGYIAAAGPALFREGDSCDSCFERWNSWDFFACNITGVNITSRGRVLLQSSHKLSSIKQLVPKLESIPFHQKSHFYQYTGSMESLQPADTEQESGTWDGSWIQDWYGGIGFIMLERGNLVGYRSARKRVCCPIQAEAEALREAVNFAIHLGGNHCTFLFDSLQLVQACSSQGPPVNSDWRAFSEIYYIWQTFNQNLLFSVCTYNVTKTIWLTISQSKEEGRDGITQVLLTQCSVWNNLCNFWVSGVISTVFLV